ncbi:hypothetical protein [Nioella nitratireducens]|uniref:hypothetical protein n=1 Tax=Nioella nitratireducens TaxID=1287720 RepID=UPI0008FD1ED6|nr:hypothetical protein [Nioella nitratireducens]
MKRTLTGAALVLAMAVGTATFAQENTATMSPEIVSQDASASAADGSILVPILTMIFLLFVSTGHGGYAPA